MNYDSDVFREWDGKYCPLANIHKFENPHEPITKVGPPFLSLFFLMLIYYDITIMRKIT